MLDKIYLCMCVPCGIKCIASDFSRWFYPRESTCEGFESFIGDQGGSLLYIQMPRQRAFGLIPREGNSKDHMRGIYIEDLKDTGWDEAALFWWNGLVGRLWWYLAFMASASEALGG